MIILYLIQISVEIKRLETKAEVEAIISAVETTTTIQSVPVVEESKPEIKSVPAEVKVSGCVSTANVKEIKKELRIKEGSCRR